MERWVQGGYGLARRSDGAVVLVPGTLPGELVLVRPQGRRRGVAWAELQAVLEPAAERVSPDCPDAERCGGCDLRHAAWPCQAELKLRAFAEVLRRAGRQPPAGLSMLTPVPPQGWRCRVRYAGTSSRGGACGAGSGQRFGFLQRGGRAVVVPHACLQAHPAAEALRADLELLLAAQLPSLRAVGMLVEIPDAPRPGPLLTLYGVRADGTPTSVIAALRRGLPSLRGVCLVGSSGRRHGWGSAHVRLRPGGRSEVSRGLEVAVPSGGFFQASHVGNRALVDTVVQLTGAVDGRRLLELYSGAGNFTLPFAARGANVLAVEGERAAVRAAQGNIERAGLAALARCVAWDLRRGLPPAALDGVQVIVADPPRGGLRGLARSLGAPGVERLVYVSCDPPALARDLEALGQLGLQPTTWRALDLFPQTHHLEVVVLLQR